jgi:hypothetical protein
MHLGIYSWSWGYNYQVQSDIKVKVSFVSLKKEILSIHKTPQFLINKTASNNNIPARKKKPNPTKKVWKDL